MVQNLAFAVGKVVTQALLWIPKQQKKESPKLISQGCYGQSHSTWFLLN